MPAGRSCGSCGATLPGDIRWCTTCFEPVHELTARAPLHDGVVGPLRPTGPDEPHWSRWEKSTTTFGPLGRIAMTLGLVMTLVGAMQMGAFVYVILFPFVAAIALPAIWAKGWIVPGEVAPPPLPLSARKTATLPVTPGRRARQAIASTLVVIGVAVLAQGPPQAKGLVLAVATLAGVWWFVRR